jgi:hypothetical protein
MRGLLSTNTHTTGLTGEGSTSRRKRKFTKFNEQKLGFPNVATAKKSSGLVAHNLNVTDVNAVNFKWTQRRGIEDYWFQSNAGVGITGIADFFNCPAF